MRAAGHLATSDLPQFTPLNRTNEFKGDREDEEEEENWTKRNLPASISVFKNSNLSIFILFTFDDRFDHFLNLSIVIVGPLLVSPFLEAAMIQFCIPPSR